MSPNVSGVTRTIDDQRESRAGRTGGAGERTRSAIRPPIGRPDRHPAEEAREDRGNGLGGVAEDEDQLARPDDLVDETGRTGQDEDADDGGGTLHRRSVAWHRAGCRSPTIEG